MKTSLCDCENHCPEGQKKDQYRSSRIFYCIEAALEYFIAIMVGETYLAKIAGELGASDALTGVLYAFTSLGCAFQILAILLSGRSSVKRWVTPMHILNQLCFTLVYAVPLFEFSKTAKIVLFAALLLLGQILSNVAIPAKINWFMSLVDNEKRGRFTAKKEILSLMGGMVFSFTMGNLIDLLEAKGNMKGAFLIGMITVFILMLLHTATLLLSKEKRIERKKVSSGRSLINLLRNKNLRRVIGVSVLWYATNYMIMPFTGSYRINELGFSMTFCSVLAILYSIVRICFSMPMGRLADKRGFADMLSVCFMIQGCAYLVNIFTVPANGYVFYTVYYTLCSIAAAGITSAQINLVYDYVDEEMRMGALAVSNAISGAGGFLVTLAISPVVTLIQKNGNKVLGIPMYAQQLLSFCGVLMMIVILLYIRFVLKRKNENRV